MGRERRRDARVRACVRQARTEWYRDVKREKAGQEPNANLAADRLRDGGGKVQMRVGESVCFEVGQTTLL